RHAPHPRRLRSRARGPRGPTAHLGRSKQVTRLATAAAIAAVLLVAAFLAGRWTKRCECAPDLPALAQASTGFVEAYVTPPSGPRLRPTQEVRSAEPTHLPLAGCEPGATTPDTSLPR